MSSNSWKSNVVCRHYSLGSCRLGGKCKFLHDDSSSASLHNNNTSTTNGGGDDVVMAGEEDIPASGFGVGGNGNDTIMSDTNASGFSLGQQQQQQQQKQKATSSKSEEKKVNPPSHITGQTENLQIYPTCPRPLDVPCRAIQPRSAGHVIRSSRLKGVKAW